MAALRDLNTVTPRGDMPPLSRAEIAEFNTQVPEWRILEQEGIQHLQRVFTFKDFAQALAFTNKVGQLAEANDHHPAILTEWGRVTVTWWTHKVKGLHRNDFIMAAETDQLYG